MTELRYDFGAQVKNVPMNSGKTVYFTRFTPLDLQTTALTEATNPSAISMTAATVSATLAEYGGFTKVGSLYSMTSIETGLTEHVSVHGQNAGETVDRLIRTQLVAGATAQVAGGNALSAVTATDVLTGLEIRKAVRTLKNNKARKFEGGLFRGIIGPYTAMDLMGNSEWLDAHRYTTSDAIERGVVGKLHGVEFVESNDQHSVASGASSANVYSNFIMGANAYGVINLGSVRGPSVYVKNPGTSSTDNPIDMFSTVGWKIPFAVKVLNSDWIVNVRTGATQ